MDADLNPGTKSLLLLEQFDNLNTFAEANEWDRQAKEEIAKLTKISATFDAETQKLSKALEKLRKDRSRKSFVPRIFSDKRHEDSLEGALENIKTGREATEKLIRKLKRCSDLTPNNPGEQRDLLGELSLQKKQLLTSQKELNCQMQEIKPTFR